MIRAVALAFAGLLLVSGCRQGVGDRCQVTGDCQSDLICVLPAGATAITGGKCEPQDVSDASSFQTDDLVAPLHDFSTADAEHDFSTADTDASTVD